MKGRRHREVEEGFEKFVLRADWQRERRLRCCRGCCFDKLTSIARGVKNRCLKICYNYKIVARVTEERYKNVRPLPPICYVNVAGPVVGACCGKRSGPAREDVVAKWGPECRYEWLALVLLWTTSRRVLSLFLGVLVAGMRP